MGPTPARRISPVEVKGQSSVRGQKNQERLRIDQPLRLQFQTASPSSGSLSWSAPTCTHPTPPQPPSPSDPPPPWGAAGGGTRRPTRRLEDRMEMNSVDFFPPPRSRTGSDFNESSSSSSSSSLAQSAWEPPDLLLVSRQPHRSIKMSGQVVNI